MSPNDCKYVAAAVHYMVDLCRVQATCGRALAGHARCNLLHYALSWLRVVVLQMIKLNKANFHASGKVLFAVTSSNSVISLVVVP